VWGVETGLLKFFVRLRPVGRRWLLFERAKSVFPVKRIPYAHLWNRDGRDGKRRVALDHAFEDSCSVFFAECAAGVVKRHHDLNGNAVAPQAERPPHRMLKSALASHGAEVALEKLVCCFVRPRVHHSPASVSPPGIPVEVRRCPVLPQNNRLDHRVLLGGPLRPVRLDSVAIGDSVDLNSNVPIIPVVAADLQTLLVNLNRLAVSEMLGVDSKTKASGDAKSYREAEQQTDADRNGVCRQFLVG